MTFRPQSHPPNAPLPTATSPPPDHVSRVPRARQSAPITHPTSRPDPPAAPAPAPTPAPRTAMPSPAAPVRSSSDPESSKATDEPRRNSGTSRSPRETPVAVTKPTCSNAAESFPGAFLGRCGTRERRRRESSSESTATSADSASSAVAPQPASTCSSSPSCVIRVTTRGTIRMRKLAPGASTP